MKTTQFVVRLEEQTVQELTTVANLLRITPNKLARTIIDQWVNTYLYRENMPIVQFVEDVTLLLNSGLPESKQIRKKA